MILGLPATYSAISFGFMPSLDILREQGMERVLIALILPLAVLLVQVTAITFAFLRKNWARILLLVLLVVAILGNALSLWTFTRLSPPGSFAHMATTFMIGWGLLAFRALGIGLLFTPSASAWFSSRAPER